MPRKNIASEVADFTQSMGLLIRRVRAAAASHELSAHRSGRAPPSRERWPGHYRRSGARGKHEAAVDGNHRRCARGMRHGRAQAPSYRRPPGEYRADRQRRRRAEELPRRQNVPGWRRPSPSSTNANGKRCSRPARSSSAWWKMTGHEGRSQFVSDPATVQIPRRHLSLEIRCRTPGARCGTATSSSSSAARASPLIGTWMTRLATSWLVYRLTHSALLLGIVSFAGQIVSFLLGPFAGVWVERLNRRKLLVWTQAVAAVQSLAGRAHPRARHHALARSSRSTALQGLINAFDMPAASPFSCRWSTTATTSATPSPSTPRWPTARGSSARRSPAW